MFYIKNMQVQECTKVRIPKKEPNAIVIRDTATGKYQALYKEDVFEHRHMAMKENKRRKMLLRKEKVKT